MTEKKRGRPKLKGSEKRMLVSVDLNEASVDILNVYTKRYKMSRRAVIEALLTSTGKEDLVTMLLRKKFKEAGVSSSNPASILVNDIDLAKLDEFEKRTLMKIIGV